jgi:hypothetical protein
MAMNATAGTDGRAATPLPVHPFPARMAPELALERLPAPKPRCHVLDPMMGSGTIPVLAGVGGHMATGFDLDPLALLIAQTWGRPLPKEDYLHAAAAVAEDARVAGCAEVVVADEETRAFIDRWFDVVAQGRLAALAAAIDSQPPRLRAPLWCAFSRLIITKDAGASLARDVSHSRPHKVREKTDFDPIARFEASARDVQRRHATLGEDRPTVGELDLDAADARALPLEDDSIDMVMTSPPYLVAIDYLRGHRMSLVWMGHTLGALRELRGSVVGSERSENEQGDHEALLAGLLGRDAPKRVYGVLRRYVNDLAVVLSEITRVLRAEGRATFVVADATLFGVPVALSELLDTLARDTGLERVERIQRELPTDRRYLPPPISGDPGTLDRRMRTETCLGYIAP